MSGHTAHPPRSEAPGRLKKRSDFLAVRKGERRKGPFFLLEVLDRGDGGVPRVGYTVTKKQGNAVERNRMRRRLKEAVRLAAGFAMCPGHDYVVVARRDALDASFSRLTSALKDRIEGRRSRPARVTGRNGGGGTAAQTNSREERAAGIAPDTASGQTAPSRSSRIRDGQ